MPFYVYRFHYQNFAIFFWLDLNKNKEVFIKIKLISPSDSVGNFQSDLQCVKPRTYAF